MSLQKLRHFFVDTLRGRLILGVAIVHAIMMTLFIFDTTVRQRAMLLESQAEHATTMARFLALSGAAWLAADDVSGLQELVEAERTSPEIRFAMLTDRRGRILAHTDTAKIGLYVTDLPASAEQSVLARTLPLVDVAVPAMLGRTHVGWARIGLGQVDLTARLARMARLGAAYALGAIVIGAFIAWRMGLRITQRLYAVQDTIGRVRAGERTARSDLTGCDEAASIAQEFNAALDLLDARDQALIQGEEQLRQAQKMEAVGQLAGGIAHDFNNILTAILGYASMLRARTPQDDPRRASIDQILAAGERAAHLTHGLLAFSRKQVIDLRPVDLNLVVHNVEKLLVRLIGEDIELSTTLADQALVAMADASQVEQTLMNLATNARDAMPHGGRLAITTREVAIDADSARIHGLAGPGPHAVLTISDTGEGMSRQTRDRIFEPFFTTKEVGRGTGLGMAIVYGIVKGHNGGLSVYSEPGLGTTFHVYLPLVASDVPSDEVETQPMRSPGGHETILLAEDDAGVRELVEAILEDAGYRVIVAVDGTDAVEQFHRHEADVDMLILDVVMPRMSGKEACDAIRGARPRIGALFVSGYTADLIHRKGLLDPDAEFLSKPLRPVDLLQKVRDLLDAPSSSRPSSVPRPLTRDK